jgi:hypothetical protein
LEEVEHLFHLIEVKITTTRIDFTKVEINNKQIQLHFLPPKENAFYEKNNAPFQKIMKRIHELKQFQPHLKQNKKQLKLIANIKNINETKNRLAEIHNFLKMLEQ